MRFALKPGGLPAKRRQRPPRGPGAPGTPAAAADTPTPSAARQAAEALFAPLPPPTPEAPAPQVIVRRRRVALPPAGDAAAAGEDEAPATPARDSKVFRVEAPLEPGADAGAEVAAEAEAEADAAAAAAEQAERSRRRRAVREDRLPGAPVVTRLKEDAASAAARLPSASTSASGSSREGLSRIERELVQRAQQRLDATLAEIEAMQRYQFVTSAPALERDWSRIEKQVEKTALEIREALAKYG
jgi:hypothetical protein